MEINNKYNVRIDFASNSYKDNCSESNFDINYSICKFDKKIFDFDNYVKDFYNYGISTVDSLFFINNVCYLVEFKAIAHDLFQKYDIYKFLDNHNIILTDGVYNLPAEYPDMINCELEKYMSKKSIYDNLKLKAIESYNLLSKLILKKKFEMKYFVILKEEHYILEQQIQSENNKKSIKESLNRLRINNVLGYYFNEINVMSSKDFIDFYKSNINNIHLNIY